MAPASFNTLSGSVVGVKDCRRFVSEVGDLCARASRFVGTWGQLPGLTNRRTVPTRFVVALQSVLQDRLSNTVAVWGLLSGGSVMMLKMSSFMIAKLMDRGGSCFREFVSGLVA